MAKYRRLPNVIDAIQWHGDNAGEIVHFLGPETPYTYNPADHTFLIKTLEGDMTAPAGDWIIKGVQGEFYPCKPDIFPQIYEPV